MRIIELSNIQRAFGLLTALIAVLVVVFGVHVHPASAAAGAETRVRASGESIQPFVGPPRHVSPGQGRGSRVSYDGFVVATGVAANGARVFTSADPHVAGVANSIEKPAFRVIYRP